MEKTTFEIPKMDCPSEESLIRIKLGDIPEVKKLEFEIPNRKLTVFHEGKIEVIEKSILDLNLGGQKINTESIEGIKFEEDKTQKKLLWAVLVINFSFFLLEVAVGIFSKSMGLVADSLDMLADSFVYGISILAVGGTLAQKKSVARLAGYFQILLATIGFAEILRKFWKGDYLPDYTLMISVSFLALLGNGVCLYLLQKSKSKEAHIQASMIFTSNDVIINLGVILAGFLVFNLESNKPDLVIGAIVFVLVLQGALRILKLGK